MATNRPKRTTQVEPTEPTMLLGLRLPAEVFARLDRVRGKVSRADMARVAISLGLDDVERDPVKALELGGPSKVPV